VKPVAMKVKHGDMIKLAENGEFDVIVHWCNCECIMGSIAEQIEKTFPGAYEADRGTEACDSSKIGRLSIAKVKVKNNKWLVIVNGYIQLLSGGNVNYHALREVMKQVQRNFYGQRIGYPEIGSAGPTGSEWDLIKKIIDKELYDEDHTLVQLSTMDKRSIAPNGRFAETQSNFTKINKRQKTDQGTSPSASFNREQFDNAEENTTDQTRDESLLNLLVEKLTDHKSCNGEEDVKDEIQQLLLEGEIPRGLIPQPKKPNQLFMAPQGLYPPWVHEIASIVLKQLKKKCRS
jgi:O-acetyl-ADP-ribose deacetylase (regulator of RNase III)